MGHVVGRSMEHVEGRSMLRPYNGRALIAPHAAASAPRPS